MKSTSKTYSSVKEALESGALDLPNANHGRMPASSSNSASARHVGRSVAIALVASPSAAAAVDIAGLTREELRRLRSEDPFLYYSIPAARRRLHRFQDDETNAAASANEARDGNPPRESAAVPRRRSSAPGARRAQTGEEGCGECEGPGTRGRGCQSHRERESERQRERERERERARDNQRLTACA